MARLYSFVLPAYKAAYLKDAIDSILAQTYTNFELIVVNDASPEGLSEIIDLYDDSRIQYYVNDENIGGKDLVAQWNYSISYAKGEYLILASDDDIYHPMYLEKMDRLVNKYPDCDVFRSRVCKIDGKGNAISIEGYLPEYMMKEEYLYHWVSSNIYSGIPFYLFKRDKLLSAGSFVSFPSAWHSDDATVIKMADNGLACDNEILFYFRMSGSNISSKHNNKNSIIQKTQALAKFYDWYKHNVRLEPVSRYSNVYEKTINRGINKLLYNKIEGQFNITAMSVVVRNMSQLQAPPIVTVRRIIKYLGIRIYLKVHRALTNVLG